MILKQEASPDISISDKIQYYDDKKPYVVLECINDSMCLDISSIPELIRMLSTMKDIQRLHNAIDNL